MKLGPIDLKRREKTQEGEVRVPIESQQMSANVIVSSPQASTVEEIEEESADIHPELEGEADTSLHDRLSRIKGTAAKTLSPLGKAGKFQLQTFRDEGKDLKQLLSSNEVVIYKTDAVAVVLRKLGRFFEFLDEYNNLVREGYEFVYSEPVESFFEIPITGIKTKLGKLYYFHHQKYAESSACAAPDLSRHHQGHVKDRARDADDIPLPMRGSASDPSLT